MLKNHSTVKRQISVKCTLTKKSILFVKARNKKLLLHDSKKYSESKKYLTAKKVLK